MLSVFNIASPFPTCTETLKLSEHYPKELDVRMQMSESDELDIKTVLYPARSLVPVEHNHIHNVFDFQQSAPLPSIATFIYVAGTE